MPQLGASRITAAYSTNGLSDSSGIPLISSSNDFGASPLGIAARSQAVYGIANAQFNLLPEDPTAEIADIQNPLPYWSVMNYSDGRIVPLSFYDTATGTYSIELNPTAGSASDYIELKTRSYLLTDDNLALRQKAYLTMSKGTAYAGSTQFNVVLSAEYFDVNGTSLSSYAIGTALDNTAMTSISGVTTSGSAAISASAAYVDFTIKLNVTATVTSGVKVYLKSFFIATSQAATGSFLVTQTFTSSGTWTRPTGVDYVTIVAMGGGGGGGGGALYAANNSTGAQTAGGNGGTTGPWLIHRDLYVGGTAGASVSVGIGAGGNGGTAMTFTKAAAATTQSNQAASSGAAGGATTFGSYISVGGSNINTYSDTIYAPTTVAGKVGGLGGYSGGNSSVNAENGTDHGMSAYTSAPFTPAYVTAGSAGANGVGTGGGGTANGTGGTANGLLGIGGSGGGGGGGIVQTTPTAGNGGVGGAGASGSGGGAASQRVSATQTVVVTGGAGRSAPTVNLGGAGGGGGAAVLGASSSTTYNASTLTMNSGAGGSGQSGFLTVAWIA